MLDIILKILGILGITLLILLAVIIVVLILVLFFPITYKVSGAKNTEEMYIKARFYWLFGFIRGRFLYPEPGNILVKCLWITLYDSKEVKDEPADNAPETAKQSSDTEQHEATKQPSPEEENTASEEFTVEALQQECEQEQFEQTSEPKSKEALPEDDSAEASAQKGLKAFIISKYEKIKYTIKKIYDKIKHIWENIAFYRDLLNDEQTKGLIAHAWMRLKKILKNIRPRKLRANITFGASSPDTTGYVLAIYGMLSPILGKHINITSDFTQAIFQGDFYASGHITVFQLLFHSLMVLFDKRLKLLRTRLQRHKNQMK